MIRLREFILFLVFFLVILANQNVFATLPPPPDLWFKAKPSFDQSTLPNGVEIVENNPNYDHYALINKNPEPFYLVREVATNVGNDELQNRKLQNSELPKEYEPIYKITTNQAYRWVDLGQAYGWGLARSNNVLDTPIFWADVDEDYIYFHTDPPIPDLRRGDWKDRPASVNIPNPQNFKILGFYKGSPVEIKGTLSYLLNEEYNPRDDEFKAGSDTFSVPQIIILLIVLGVGLLIYKTWHYRA